MLWYGDCLKKPQDPIDVIPIFLTSDRIGKNEKNGKNGKNGKIDEMIKNGKSENDCKINFNHENGNQSGVGMVCDVNEDLHSDTDTPTDTDTMSRDKSKNKKKKDYIDQPQTKPPSSPSPSSSSSLSSSCSVLRQSISPLDDELLQIYCTHKLTSHFSGALLDFSEWDDHLRESYVWPDHITYLLR